MTPIRAVLLDFDGVIAHTQPHYFWALWSFFGFKNIPIQKSEWDRGNFSTKSVRQIIEYIKETHGHDIDFDELITHVDILQSQSIAAWLETDPSLLVFLEYCENNHIQLAIGSNSRANRVIQILKSIGISQYFLWDTPGIHENLNIIWAEDLSHHKPDPEVWIRLAELLEVSPETCLVIEDWLPWILGARDCSAIPLYYHRFCPFDKEIEEQANLWCSDFLQVIEFIESQNVPTK